jgi:hypothetical protein
MPRARQGRGRTCAIALAKDGVDVTLNPPSEATLARTRADRFESVVAN